MLWQPRRLVAAARLAVALVVVAGLAGCGGGNGANSGDGTGGASGPPDSAQSGPVSSSRPTLSASATAPPGPGATTTSRSGGGSTIATPATAARLDLAVLARFPHDPNAFTEGLVIANGALYESTGLYGSSTLRQVELSTGKVITSVSLDPSVFGEGLALAGERLVQLTWRNGVAYTYDRASFSPAGTLRYSGEGWGLCFNGTELVMSNGSADLTFRDPATFAVVRTVTVRDAGRPIDQLNELECVGDHVFANVWLTSRIARIDAASGRVDGWVDAAALVPPGAGGDDVLNGIAYDPADGTFLLTGKRWPTLYRARIG